MNLTAIRERIALDAIRLAPKGLVSAAIGWGARKRLPRQVRSPVYRAFARWAGAQVDEAELPLHEYPSLGHFFARRLRPGLRPVADKPGIVVAPCDGVIAAIGAVERGQMIQAKGIHYELARLVVDDQLAAGLEGGAYLTIYLSPRDYHRVHTPMAAELLGYDHVPGSHFPVNPLFSRSVDGLMAQNERVVFHLQSEVGAACLVMVAALGVSNMEVACDRMETRYLRASRPAGHTDRQVRFDQPIDITRGEELGAFHLGSTTILIFAPGSVTLDPLRAGDTVRFGQPIGRRAARTSGVEPVGTIG